MTYLDERIEFTLTITGTTPSAGMYKYEIEKYDISTTSPLLVFVGNMYYNGTDRRIVIDATDIIRSLKTAPSKSFFTESGYSETQNVNILDRFAVKLYLDTTLNSGYKIVNMVYRYPNYRNTNNFSNGNAVFFDTYTHETEEDYTVALQGTNSNGSLALVPHYPLLNTTVYKFAQSFLCGMYLQEIELSLMGGDYTSERTFETFNYQNGELLLKPIGDLIDWAYSQDIGDSDVDIFETKGNKKICTLDNCYKRYYLFWQDRFGGFQSQAFNEYATYSETFNTVETQNYKNERNKSNIQVQPKWKLRSGWISEDVYPLYESIYVSPILLLYDTHEDRLHEVIVNSDYIEKTYKNEKKMLNLSLDLEAISKQNITY